MKKRAYIICAVRNASEEMQREVDEFAEKLRSEGWQVHNPKFDAPQDDPTGFNICDTHLRAMEQCTKVFVFWDVMSSGSHFDLGMAFALHKPIEMVREIHPDGPGKSYAKVIRQWSDANPE